MSVETTTETVDFECKEDRRTAHLLLEWQPTKGERRLTGVHCDNPRLASLEQWECRWSCWRKLEKDR
jgi:hypothetical protein